jgi:hypothetical protein
VQLQINFNTLWQKWVGARQYGVGRILSALYGKPVAVLPPHAVGLAGAAVLWVWQEGTRHLIMVRPKTNGSKHQDVRARFISCLGLGAHADMPSALRHTLGLQLGDTFTRLLPAHTLAADTLAAAPMLSLTDEDTGAQLPMQVLAWVAEVRPATLEVLKLAPTLELVMVAENALSSNHVSPTHRLLWQAVQRHVVKKKLTAVREDLVTLMDEETLQNTSEGKALALRKPTRILH